jgi:hypothetical protein
MSINRTFPHLAMRLRGGENTDAYVYTAAHDALRRLGACWSDERGQTRGRAGGWHRGGCVVARVAARADVIDVMPEKEHSTDAVKV